MTGETILSILKGHGTYVGQRWVFIPIDLKASASEISDSILSAPPQTITVSKANIRKLVKAVTKKANHENRH